MPDIRPGKEKGYEKSIQQNDYRLFYGVYCAGDRKQFCAAFVFNVPEKLQHSALADHAARYF